MKTYPFTNDYFYCLFCKNPSLDFDDLTLTQKRELIETLFGDLSKTNHQEIFEAINSGEQYLSISLAQYLFKIGVCCNCEPTRALDFNHEIVRFFWKNATVLFKEIFDEAKLDYLQNGTYFEELDDTEEEATEYQNSPIY